VLCAVANAGSDEPEARGFVVEPPKTIAPLQLLDQHGETAAFPAAGTWQLAFFGFTTCPDVCPTTMQKTAQVLKQLGADAHSLRVVFLSVDSERDRPEVVRKFLDAHDARILGLTGPAGAVQAVVNAFGVIVRRYQGRTAMSYRIEHSAFLYLLDPQGRVVMFYPENVAPQQVAADFKQRLTADAGRS
jgi:protein SCO1/2